METHLPQPAGRAARRRMSLIWHSERAWARLQLALLLTSLMLFPGCGGCRSRTGSTPTSGNAATTPEKPKPDFEFLRISTQPSTGEKDELFAKPGHWSTAAITARANNFDFSGDLNSYYHDDTSMLIDLEDTPFRLQIERPAILPRGQRRLMSMPIYVSAIDKSHRANINLRSRGGSREILAAINPVQRMAIHQYFMVVLAKSPDSYRYLESVDSVRAPQASEGAGTAHYKVIMPRVRAQALPPLPNSSLYWTAIAYVVWDNLDPSLLTPDQQQAMIDWLHWGGQLIVSGPDSLDSLKDSFLDPYLPASGGETWKIPPDAFVALNDVWAQDGKRLTPVREWSGQKLKLAPDARALVGPPEAALVVERPVGHGRVVTTAFRLSERELVNWTDFDNFLNGAILRRNPRVFSLSGEQVAVAWMAAPLYDPLQTTRVRFFTRDNGGEGSVLTLDGDRERAQRKARRHPSVQGVPGYTSYQQVQFDDPGSPALEPGAGGWDDLSGPSLVARETLREAAGITVPKARLVTTILIIYLVVLVPVNWAAFRLMNRVEWAWAAAPVISLIFAGVVVEMAQLDIGFARSRTEVAVMEIEAGYPRGHLTRYTALYTSLSTAYDFQFEDPSAVALPFANGQQVLTAQSRGTVTFVQNPNAKVTRNKNEPAVQLKNFEVSSNTTGMVHSEQMYSLGGPLVLKSLGGGKYQLTNDTKFEYSAAAVVTNQQAAWIGSLKAGAAAEFTLAERPNDESIFADQLERAPITSRNSQAVGLNLNRMLRLAYGDVPPGEVRLVAFTDEDLAGLTIIPVARQARRACVVVAHLARGPEPDPRSDQNTRSQVATEPVKTVPDDGPPPPVN